LTGLFLIMERRPYFLLGDLLVNAAVGAVSGLVALWLVPAFWNDLLSSFIGMVAGMGVGLVLGVAAMPFLGAFEVMLPAILSGMIAGMVVGTSELNSSSAATVGALVGLATIAGTYGLTFWSQRHG